MAKKDNPGECPGEDWMLLVQRGKRGEQGLRGEKGLQGQPGKDGAQPVEVRYDLKHMKQLMVLDNGDVLETDVEPLARAIRGE
jgi:hypothetical protein